MKKLTISDIARMSGFAKSTISAVLNGKSGVNIKTRERVLEIVNHLGYQPSDVARGLSVRQSKIIGLIVRDLDNPFHAKVIRGVEREIQAEGYGLILCTTDNDRAKEREVVDMLMRKEVDGFIIMPVTRSVDQIIRIKNQGYPVVALSPLLSQLEVDCVYTDERSGTYQAAKYLLDLGHSRIALLTAPDISELKIAGFQDALAERGVPLPKNLLAEAGLSIDHGYQAAAELLSHPEPPTALICFNDMAAIGALLAAREGGFRVPEDLSVIGFDGLEFTAALNPPLTTVDIPRTLFGQTAAALLLQRIAGEADGAYREIPIPTQLVIRQSCAPLSMERAAACGD